MEGEEQVGEERERREGRKDRYTYFIWNGGNLQMRGEIRSGVRDKEKD